MNELLNILREQLNLIQDIDIKKDATHFISMPEIRSAFMQTSSSTGLYHPVDENSKYGLLVHTLRVITVAILLFNTGGNVHNRQEEFDCLILAALLHDVPFKIKESSFANRNHAKDNALFFAENTTLTGDKKDLVLSAILNHNGRWESACGDDFDKYPQTEMGAILHLADYIASRNNIRVEINSMDYVKQCLVD